MTEAVAAVLNRRMAICVFTGFASGLPFFFLIQFIPAWLRDEGVGLKEIGFFALVQLPYVWKFLWAPALDRYVLPGLGRRRGWMLGTQIALFVSMSVSGYRRPGEDLQTIMWLALIVAFFSATQDIALDAYRRELLPDRELGLGNAIHIQAYRVAGLVPGTLGLILADHLPWHVVFPVVGVFMVLGMGMTLVISEANKHPTPPRTLREAIVEPFREFLTRNGVRYAVLCLAFMFFYKLGDSMATALSTPFYLDLGFSKSEIGLIAKNAALWPSIIGGILGGILMLKIGINKALWVFGAFQLITILGFAGLAEAGSVRWVLAVVISLEYLGVGLGTAAFVAFIARATTPALAATQIALLTAVTALPRTLSAVLTGYLVEGGEPDQLDGIDVAMMTGLMLLGLPEQGLGWTRFFLLCTALAIPGMLLLFWVAPWREAPSELESTESETPAVRAANDSGPVTPAH
ncbi:MAG: AmpG family muropeptide MFS transporter [Planctomycetota bacterium]|jgi:PAT family beta-lactamase induction signal transducer AmpG